MIVITYEYLSATKYPRIASLRANLILGIIEPLFWFTAFILSCMAVGSKCTGAGCGLSVVLILLCLAQSALALGLAIVGVSEWREFKRKGGESSVVKGGVHHVV
jgi:hypothetical protein